MFFILRENLFIPVHFFEEKRHGLKLKTRVYHTNDWRDFPLHLRHIDAKILGICLQTAPLMSRTNSSLHPKSNKHRKSFGKG